LTNAEAGCVVAPLCSEMLTKVLPAACMLLYRELSQEDLAAAIAAARSALGFFAAAGWPFGCSKLPVSVVAAA
jgi:hypothetical protein